MVARQKAHDLTTLRIDPDVRAKRIHYVNAFRLGQLPGPRGEGVRLGREGTDRAEIDDVALQVAVERLAQIGGDFRVLAPARLAHLGDAGDLGREADAAGARDAARHMGFDQRAEIKVIDGALGFAETAEIDAIGHRLVLQIAFATLIADRAIERMVDQQEFHHALAGLLDHGAVGLDDRGLTFRPGAQILDLHRAGGRGFGRATHNLDKAHPTVPRDRQTLVIAKARDLDPRLFTSLDQRHGPGNLDFLVVDDNLAEIRHALFRPQIHANGAVSCNFRAADRAICFRIALADALGGKKGLTLRAHPGLFGIRLNISANFCV